MANPDVERAVLASIEDVTRIPADRIRPTDFLVQDLKMDGDDFSFVFVPNVEKVLGVKTDPAAWKRVWTVQDAISVFSSALET